MHKIGLTDLRIQNMQPLIYSLRNLTGSYSIIPDALYSQTSALKYLELFQDV